MVLTKKKGTKRKTTKRKRGKKKVEKEKPIKRKGIKRIYSIILTNHDKRLKTICVNSTEEGIYKKLYKLLKENENVVFPMQYNNHYHQMVEARYELIVLKRREESDSLVNKVKNEYGEYVDYETDNDKWIVIDRANYNMEETFWVYGYHPKIQRKTFQWVFDNFVLKGSKNKYMFKNIVLYLNKILFECDGNLEMVICKNKNDSVRFYNQLEQWSRDRKLKYVMFTGDIAHSKHKRDWMEKIMKLTSWNIKKVKRCSTRD